jgi:regulator of sigma E protease
MNSLTDTLISLPAFIVGISILVGVHEFGHFWVARRLGIKTLRFSIGFGRVLWSRFGKDGTEYALSAIPLGGYVRMVDERDAQVSPADLPFAFNRAPVWKRIAVLFAGPGFNFLFAIFAYWLLFIAGLPGLTPQVGVVTPNSLAASAGLLSGDEIQSVAGHKVTTREAVVLAMVNELVDDGIVELRVKDSRGAEREVNLVATGRSQELTEPYALLPGLGFDFVDPPIPAVLGQITPDDVAAKAGLQTGDRIVRVDDQPVADFHAFRALIEARAKRDVVIDLVRQGASLTVRLTVAEKMEQGKSVGRIGVTPAPIVIPTDMRTVQRYGVLESFPRAMAKTWETSALSVKLMWKLVTGKVSVKGISGPIGIASMAGFAAQQGLTEFTLLLALISISIGILNLMPIPILDGGQIVYQLAELVKGRPVSERAQLLGQQAGIVLLGLLMIVALFNDLAPHLS